ncbi:MAG: hypothetical protein ISR47_00080 [Rhodospirillales bacterium]|nr:hypothetical protein [Rhodospirillales bacterium]
MAKKSEQVEEVIGTGKSDRKVRNEFEIFEPSKSSTGKTVYKIAHEAGLTSSKRAEPLYPDAADARPAALPQEPAKAPAPAKAVTAREKGRVIAQTVVGSFVDRMKTEARRKGGRLSIDDIAALDQEFLGKAAALEVLFEKTFEEYAQANAEYAAKDRRENPFDRLMIAPLEKLLAGGKGPSAAKGGISRRIMPGFFMALNMMLGPDEMAAYRAKAGAIFDRVNKSGGAVDWSAFFAAAKDLRLDVSISMAVHFAKPDKREAWFLDIINNHLAPPETDPDTDAGWTLSRHSYERLIDVLFSDLMTAVGSPGARKTITKRFGPETCASVAAIMKGLGA